MAEPWNISREKAQDNAQTMTRLMEKLKLFAVPMQKIEFSRETYKKLFPGGKVKTPIENVKLGEHQYEKLKARGREEYLGAVYQTLSDPVVVIETEKGNDRVKLYTKSFQDFSGEKIDAVISVVVDIGGLSVSISTHRRNVNNTLNKIKGIIPQGKPCTHRLRRLSAASRGVLNPSFPHSLGHVRASTVATSLRSSIKKGGILYEKETALPVGTGAFNSPGSEERQPTL